MGLRWVISWLLVVFACAGCRDTYAVLISISAAPGLSEAALSSVRTLVVRASGAESGEKSVAIEGFSVRRQERFRYLPTVSGGEVTLEVTARDLAGAQVATGRGTVKLSPGESLPFGITIDDPKVVVTPGHALVGRTSAFTFSANRAVAWRVEEPLGGTIAADGRYQAPSYPGLFHVTATSLEDAAAMATVTVLVAFNQLSVLAGQPGGVGTADGVGPDARFSSASGHMVTNAAGTVLYYSDLLNHAIRKIELATAQVSTVAGRPGQSGSKDTGPNPGDPPASFNFPVGLALDLSETRLYVADGGNHVIRQIDLTRSSPVVSTFAGRMLQRGFVDSPDPTQAQFNGPHGVVLDPANGVLYVADSDNRRIRRVSTATGATTTLAGDGTVAIVDSPGPVAFEYPEGITFDGTALYVTEPRASTIRKVIPSPLEVTTLVGTAKQPGNLDGTGAAARFSRPIVLAWAGPTASSTLVISDDINGNIRRLDVTTLAVTTIAGWPSPPPSTPAWTDGVGTLSRFNEPRGLAVTPGAAYVGDPGNRCIRKIADPFGAAPAVSTYAGLPLRAGSTDGAGTSAHFDHVADLISVQTDLYAADYYNRTVRKLAVATSGGYSALVTTVAGSASSLAPPVDGTGTAARFSKTTAFAFDGATKLYILDSEAGSIRALDLQTRAVKTILTGLVGPRGIAIANQTQLYVTTANHTVLAVPLPSGPAQLRWGVRDLAGNADGVDQSALFNTPTGILYDGKGSFYVADSANHTIRRIDLESGQVSTVAGKAGAGGFADGQGDQARLRFPYQLAWTPAEQLLITDEDNNLVRLLDLKTRELVTLLGSPSASGVRSGPAPGGLNKPTGLALLPGGELAVSNWNEMVVQLAY